MPRPLAERAYALLLRAFPRAFRDRFGGAMTDTFRAQWRDVRTRSVPARLAFWLRVVVDSLGEGLGERVAGIVRHPAQARVPLMESLRQDLRFAVRAHRASPAATWLAVLVLAVGIGANTAIFSVVEAMLLRSLPFRDPAALVSVGPTGVRDDRASATLYGTASRFAFDTWRAQRDAFADVAGYRGGDPIVTGLGDPERLMTYRVTGNFFSMLGATPAVGRAIVADDTLPNAPAVVVLSDAIWRTRFGGDANVVGRTITLDSVPHTIVGVMPRAFHFPERATVWSALAALRTDSAAPRRAHGPWGSYYTVARLRPGVTVERAMARLDATLAGIAAGDADWKDVRAVVIPMRRFLVGDVRRPLLLVLAAVSLVLLVACANVANIQLARAVDRTREIAVRLAMGAPRGRLVRQLLTESVVLSLAGGALGIALAYAAVPLLVRLAGPELPGFTDVGVNGRVLALTLVASVLTGIVSGIAPALHGLRDADPRALRDGTARSGTSAGRHRLIESFVVGQMALTMVLLVGASLLVVSFARLMRVDTGFAPERVLVADFQNTGHQGDTATIALADAVLERARAIPGVATAAMSTGTPLDVGAFGSGIEVVGEPKAERERLVVYTAATGEYFRALGIPLRRGRLLGARGEARGAVVVNESLVRAYFPGHDPIGRTIRYFGGQTGTIVGVVGDTKAMALADSAPPHVYQAFDQAPASYLKLVVRATGDPATLAGAVRAALREVDPAIPIDHLRTMRGVMAESVARPRFYTTLLSIFAGAALLIAASGLYGVVSYTVTRRTREMGVRLALGATAGSVVRLVLGRSGRLALAGVAVGGIGALWATRALRSMLFEVTATDPSVLAAVAALLGAVALIAAWVPARRAAQADPVQVIRAE